MTFFRFTEWIKLVVVLVFSEVNRYNFRDEIIYAYLTKTYII